MRRGALILAAGALAFVAVAAITGCGSSSSAGSGSSSGTSAGPAKLTVFAAASLTKVFPQIAADFQKTHAGARFTFDFAGTDTLTAQIEQGAPADVFAGASTKYGVELSGKGLIDTPQPFATNRLVVIVPASNPAHIASLSDLAKPGVKLVIGDPTVPIGTYTRTVLANLDATLGAGYSAKVLKNVVSNALQVTSVVGSVELGEADAGFVYVTDARSAGDKVRRIALPAAAQATATYPIAAVKDSRNAALARQFVTFVLGADAQALLQRAGFGPPPK
jgi:molybdate transport system substrate-binding protein